LRAKVPHHLIGEIPLGKKFDVARYRELALERIGEITRRGKRALVVGGVRALTRGLSELPAGNAELRREIERMTLAELQARYAALDPRGMERIDQKNRRRLVRAIEVTMLAGRPFSEMRADWGGEPAAAVADGVALDRDREELYARIDARVARMFELGVVEEVANAAAGDTAAQAIGYAEIKGFARGEMSMEECIRAIRQRTRQYAKRQLTWLRSENIFLTINLTDKPLREVAEEIARRILAAGPDSGELGGQIES
jgi:tRNA dimethylallyltransferase